MTEKSASSLQRQAIVLGLLVALVLLGMALRLHRLDTTSLWLDEILTAERIQLDLRSLISLLTSGQGGTGATQAPLAYVTTRLFTALMGHNEFTLRLQAVIFGTLSVLLIYKLGVMLWSSEVGLLGALLLAVNPHHVNMSQEARHYGLLMFLSLLSLLFLLRALERGRVVDWLGFVLCTSLNLYTHFFAFLLLAAEMLFGALIISSRWLQYTRGTERALPDEADPGASSPLRQTLSFVCSLVVIGLSYIPWLPTLALLISRQGGAELASASASTWQASLGLLRSVVRDYSGAEGAGLVFWLALLLLGLATSTRRQLSLALPILAIPFLFVAAIDPQHKYHAKYVIFILPISLLLVARGALAIVYLPTRFGRPVGRYLSAVTAALILLLFSMLAVEPLSAHYRSQNTDWRSAAQFLSERIQPGDVLLADGNGYRLPDHQRVERCLPYYLGRHGVGPIEMSPIQRGLREALEDDPNLPTSSKLWAVIYHREKGLEQRAPAELSVVDFHHVAVISLREASSENGSAAIDLLTRLMELLPAPESHFDIHLALAESYLARGHETEAEAQLEHAKAVMPDDPRAARTLSRAYVDLAAYFEESGDQGQAMFSYKQALAVDPSNRTALQRLDELSPRDTFPIRPLRRETNP